MLKCQGIMISKSRDQKQTLWFRMDKLSRLRGTIDGNLIGREPTPVKNDGRAGKIIYKDQLMIAGIRNILNQGTRNDNDKGCQLDYQTYGKW